MNVKFHKITSYTWNFQNFTCVITILVKFDIHFLGLPWEIFFGVTTDDLLHLKPLKNVKKNAIFFKLFWYKVFVHWKLKLPVLNFLVDSVLNLTILYSKEGAGSWLLRKTRGVRNPNFHVAITHASHICSHFHKERMECKERNWSAAFRPSITCNLIMHFLTICHVKLTQSTAME